MIKAYIDSDSVPVRLREIILRRLVKENIPAWFVADRPLKDVRQKIAEHTASLREPLRSTMDKEELRKVKSPIEMVVVETGANSADDRIVEMAEAPGLAITHDIPLAERLIKKGVTVIDDRGNVFSEENIRERMSERAYMAEFRENGIFIKAQKGMTDKDVNAFSNALDRELQKLKKTHGA